MNELQKIQIKHLRLQGLGYIKISQAMDISVNTVKSYCRRNNLVGVVAQKDKLNTSCNYCKNCGKEIQHQKAKKTRRYCDEKCRTQFWNKNQNKINRKTAKEYLCPICGCTFKDYPRNHRKYCSRTCYITARYKGGGASD